MLLEIKNLAIEFNTDSGRVRAVDNVTLSVNKGEVVAIVGGSGSGKTILSLSILGLIPEAGHVTNGEIIFNQCNLLKFPQKELRKLRGKNISMIFQEPMTALNPVFTIENQIAETIKIHEPKINVKERIIELLSLVGIPEPGQKMKCYPHELSGGQRQRVMIAMALACKPDLLIADEPTTALDVTIQAQILDLLRDLQKKLNMAVILITHDFGIVAEIADRVYVMHNGKIVENGNVKEIFETPKNDYTKKLLAAVPSL